MTNLFRCDECGAMKAGDVDPYDALKYKLPATWHPLYFGVPENPTLLHFCTVTCRQAQMLKIAAAAGIDLYRPNQRVRQKSKKQGKVPVPVE